MSGNSPSIARLPSIDDANTDTHLAVNVRFDTIEDWVTLRTRLGATKAVTGIDIVGRTPHDAQIYLAYSGEVEHLPAALAQHALELTSSDGEYTLALGAVSEATTANLQ